jgi:UTP--glucose-1-phosphate uridylyltransferase
MVKISKAVIPAAGLGTRFLPATKALPKEMLPIVDKPAIQYVVEEAVSSGLNHVLMITGRNKNALENHFDRAIELEQLLDSKGDVNRLGIISESSHLANIHYVRQGDPKGLGHAITKAKTFTGTEAFAVLLGDDLIHHEDTLLQEMLHFSEESGATVVALHAVDPSQVSMYGVAEVEKGSAENILKIKGFVEKPNHKDAPSNLAIIGRYILQPAIYQALEKTKPGVGGEIQLTDALNIMASDPKTYGPVYGMVFSGRRFDTGDRLSYLKTTVEIASERDDLGPEFVGWLKTFVQKL